MADASAALMEAEAGPSPGPTAVAHRAPDEGTQLATVPNNSGAVFALLERIMTDATLPMERVNQAFDFYMRVRAYEAKLAYDAALAAAQAEFPPITKNRRVLFTSSKGTTDYRHEDLANLIETIGPILAKHGISYKWRTVNEVNEPIVVTCILTHKAGHSEENTLRGPRDDSGNKNSLQGIASAVNYLERYTFKASVGVASRHDDDGKAGGGTPEPEAISAEQVSKLQLEIVRSNAHLEKFLRYLKIEKIDDLPAGRFDEAMALLDEHRSKTQ